VIDASGERVRVDVVETNGQALIEFLKLQPGTLRLCMEECTQATWLAEILMPHVAPLAVVQVSHSRGPVAREEPHTEFLGWPLEISLAPLDGSERLGIVARVFWEVYMNASSRSWVTAMGYLSVLLALTGCGGHLGPDEFNPGDASSAGTPQCSPPVPIETLSASGTFSGSTSTSRWFRDAPGTGSQSTYLLPPHLGTVTLSTCGSPIDTTLAATADCSAALVRDDDGAGCGTGAQISLPGSRIPVYVVVSAFSSSGRYMLTVSGLQGP
jgi:hypothetical protein